MDELYTTYPEAMSFEFNTQICPDCDNLMRVFYENGREYAECFECGRLEA